MTAFFKLSGGGNDFIALVEPEVDPVAMEIRAWTARGLSLGADGLFVLRRSEGGARMRYANADGRWSTLCLNGTRCAGRLAFHLGWAEETIPIVTDAGTIVARRHPGEIVALELERPAPPPVRTSLQALGRWLEGWLVTVGVPHLVLIWPTSLTDAPLADLGPALRRHPDLGAAGTNVNFVRFPSRHRLEIRSFERGVEAETLACGTGVLAATAVGLTAGLAQLPVAALTLGGFELEAATAATDDRWLLAGDARIVAEGRLAPGAGLIPAPPAWS